MRVRLSMSVYGREVPKHLNPPTPGRMAESAILRRCLVGMARVTQTLVIRLVPEPLRSLRRGHYVIRASGSNHSLWMPSIGIRAIRKVFQPSLRIPLPRPTIAALCCATSRPLGEHRTGEQLTCAAVTACHHIRTTRARARSQGVRPRAHTLPIAALYAACNFTTYAGSGAMCPMFQISPISASVCAFCDPIT